MFRARGAGERPPRVRSVEVARGRAGYGFTLSGQAPCALSGVLRGGPADLVGLRAGDQILAVNEINVKKALQEDVVKLIGRCPGVLHMVVGEGRGPAQAGSSDDEGAPGEREGWPEPRLDSKALGISRAQRVAEEMRSGGIFSMILESPALRARGAEPPRRQQRALSEPAAAPPAPGPQARGSPRARALSLSQEDGGAKAGQPGGDDAAFGATREGPEDAGLDASILNVAMVVGYLGSIELPSAGGSLESDSLQAIRGCLRRLRAEQKVHALVALRVMHDRVQLCSERAAVLAEYPAERLAFSAVCPDDRRLFGLVTAQAGEDGGLAAEEGGSLRTSCHVFLADPDLFAHRAHQGLARRFGFACTPDPDTGGCLEFPASSLPVLQFVSVLYRDMGEPMEGVRARAFADSDADAQQNTSSSSNSDSGIGNFQSEERGSRVLVVGLGGGGRLATGSGPWEAAGGRGPQPWGGPWAGAFCCDPEGSPPFEAAPPADRCWDFGKHLGPAARAEGPPVPPRSAKRVAAAPSSLGQRWLPAHVLREWQCGHASDQESYTDSTDGRSSVNCGTLPPPMSKIPADRYRLDGSLAPPVLGAPKRDWPRKALGVQNLFGPHRNVRKTKEDKKGSKLGRGPGPAQPPPRTPGRRPFGRSKRSSITRSLDDLEVTRVSVLSRLGP
ncbi:Regulator of G-protein signaling 12 [Galemys pyrenaicus]|uniref:Regulator of G-protein signaling 12 n=1 Tax=Galemys pyrenaicus TaxID=202257 RepID=A0A8J5ZVR8_GALPY|nr:Regulator of G-protein signaling 12 [Galemys pyrenaicus]